MRKATAPARCVQIGRCSLQARRAIVNDAKNVCCTTLPCVACVHFCPCGGVCEESVVCMPKSLQDSGLTSCGDHRYAHGIVGWHYVRSVVSSRKQLSGGATEGQSENHVHLFVGDVEWSFNTVERSILTCRQQSQGAALVQTFHVPCCCKTTFIELAAGVANEGLWSSPRMPT